jgi:hypothetical protein
MTADSGRPKRLPLSLPVLPIRSRRASRRGRGGVFDLAMGVGRVNALTPTFLVEFLDIPFSASQSSCRKQLRWLCNPLFAPSAISAGVLPIRHRRAALGPDGLFGRPPDRECAGSKSKSKSKSGSKGDVVRLECTPSNVHYISAGRGLRPSSPHSEQRPDRAGLATHPTENGLVSDPTATIWRGGAHNHGSSFQDERVEIEADR